MQKEKRLKINENVEAYINSDNELIFDFSTLSDLPISGLCLDSSEIKKTKKMVG